MSNSKIFTKKWMSFTMMMLGAGTIYKLYFIDGAFYAQLQEFMGLSHTQIGLIYTISGWISTFGFLAATYITDRFSKKLMIPFALIGNGLAGIALATFPPYPLLLILFCFFAVFSDMLFWPTMLKTIGLIGTEHEQGRMFGFLETGRGLIDTIVNFIALAIFVWFGSNALGFKGSILFFSALTIVIGIISYFFLEDDEISKISDKKEKNKLALDGVKAVFSNTDIWLVALNVFMVYSVYSGIKYFVPFLKEIYSMPIALASTYGIINAYGLKMLGGPIGGFISDKITKSSAKFIQIMFVITAAALFAFVNLPHNSISIYIAITCALVISSFIFSMRAVFFAPMAEVKISKEYTGAAMSLGSFIGYLPGAFIHMIYAPMLDNNSGLAGYKAVFTTMACIAVAGFIISTLLVRVIQKKKNASQI
ncbi:MAG: MFS transporter [Filifactoraceae bacterium]